MRYLALLAACGTAFCLQGCPPRGCATFVNMTGDALTVHYTDKTISVSSGGTGKVCGCVWPETFQIDTPRKTWHYVHPYVGREFMYPTFDEVLQVDRDGRIYAHQPPEASKKVIGQPPGYPLRPKT